MMPNHISEEKIFDYINQDLTPVDAHHVKEHLEYCPECQELYSFWLETLDEEIEVADGQKEKVWNKLTTSIQRYRRKSFKTWYKGILTVAACALFFITGFFTGENSTINNQQATGPTPQQEDQFVIDTDTEVYDLVHTSSGDNKGYAWYNPLRKEMILYLDDDLHDQYEANIQTANSTIYKSPISLRNGNRHVYIRDQQLQEFYRIILINRLNQKPVSSYEFQTISTK